MIKRWIFCSDINLRNLRECCNSCHEDDEMFGYQMCNAQPDVNSHGHKSGIEAVVCCAIVKLLPRTREEWAKVLLGKRLKDRKERGKE